MSLVFLLLAAIAFIIYATARLKLHPFLALLITAFGFGILSGMPLKQVVDSVNAGFGGTIGYIGIVILAGSMTGRKHAENHRQEKRADDHVYPGLCGFYPGVL
jgi:GntP family gluconate:H+ symporter